MTSLQAQARALGDPTRHKVFRYLADAERPVRVAELTEHLGLNHNAIRQHLAKLVDAGLVRESVGVSSGRGRPPLVYTVAPTAESRWDVIGPYERLALWLAEIIRSGDTPEEVGRRAGRRQLLLTERPDDPLGELVEQMARQGFEPTVDEVSPDPERSTILLNHCPFESTALADPEVVCTLHLGFAEGIADQVGTLAVEGLQPRDPRHARCRLHVRAHDTSVDVPLDPPRRRASARRSTEPSREIR
jgi:predicted ArsR family transcriptional regulator